MRKTSLLALLAIPLAGAGIVGSAALAAGDTQTPTPQNKASIQSTLRDVWESRPEAEAGDSDKEIPDAEEQKLLQSKAKITAAEAEQAAEAKLGAKSAGASLEDEDGVVVYNVIIGNQEVKVNALDGSILKVEAEEAEPESISDKMTTGHGNEPNDGSAVSDGDGETSGA